MKPLILVVEDETSLSALLRYNLESEDYRVREANDGEEALIAAAEDPPDVVILDWMLPHVSGLEVCRQLRRRPATRVTPILMLTARGEEQDKLRGFDSGADDYMSKPFSPSELLARVRALLRRYGRRRCSCECTDYESPGAGLLVYVAAAGHEPVLSATTSTMPR